MRFPQLHRRRGTRLLILSLAAAGTAVSSSAQFNNEWVEFTLSDGSFVSDKTDISSANTEVDFAWGDLDKDGWDDLILVRKQTFTSVGKRENILLMNENGVLVDRTGLYATATDVVGDNGFRTETNDRDVIFVDVDGDTWLDVVTATTLSDNDSKAIGHPRIYMNLGNDGGGNWQGLEYQEARVPQMFQFDSNNPENPRFCSVAAGDVTGDGAPDLYFGDYDSGVGAGQPPGLDMNNRLLINDGNGFFTDQSELRMNGTMLLSAFGAASVIADMNGDGANDVVKQTALNPPQHIAIVYNNPTNEGFFNIYDDIMNNEPYHVNTGDLNNDGRLDLVVSSDNQDRYRYNRGNDPLGRVIWSPPLTFQFLAGNDDGFASNNIIADLDNDGWADALFADVDVDIPGGNRRIHIYHNPGSELGLSAGDEPTLVEERQQPGNGGWLGVKGMVEADLEAGHDIAPMDIDNDGDLDLVIGRFAGMFVWINQTVPNTLFQDQPQLSLADGGTQTLTLDAGDAQGGKLYFVLGSGSGTSPGINLGGQNLPLNVDDWTLLTLTLPNVAIANSVAFLDGDGRSTASFTTAAGLDPGLAGATLWHAYLVFDGALAVEMASTAVPVSFVP